MHFRRLSPAWLAALASLLLAVPASASESIWLTDHPQHQRSLAYPIAYAFTYQMIGYGFLTQLDRNDTNFYAASFDNFLDGLSDGPAPDDDEWQWNWVAHPLWGSETYLRTRAQGYNPLQSFLFSATASVVWEFGIESWSQRPSSQDLIITPVLGSLLGELRFRWKRELLDRGDFTGAMLLVLIDPIQALTEWVGRAFGQDWSEPAFRKVDPSIPLYAQDTERVPVSVDIASIDRKPGLMVRWSIAF